jgi:hypothetical protein
LLLVCCWPAAGPDRSPSCENPAQRTEFTVADNYQRVYQRVAEQARECWTTGFIFSPQASFDVDADLLSELGEGRVALRFENVGTWYSVVTDIIRISADETLVTVMVGTDRYVGAFDQVRRWANAGTEC